MDSNTHSTGMADPLAALAAAVDGLAAQDLDGLGDAALAERVLVLRRLADRLEGHWLCELAAVDARGAAGADQGQPAPSTASWLRARLRMGAGVASGWVRTARALFRGPLTATATALCAGELSAAHASVLASGTHDLPEQVTVEAEPVLVAAARRLDPPRLRRVLGHLQLVADPDGADGQAERRHGRRGVWLSPTWDGMVAVEGLLEPEAGQTLLAALEPLAGPTSAQDSRSGGQRRADALCELARRALEGGRLPQTGGVRPQLTVTVELDSLLGRPGSLGGEGGWAGPLDPEACRRLACDGAVTRVLVSRHPTHPAATTASATHPAATTASAATTTATTTRAATTAAAATRVVRPAWPSGSRPPRPGSPRSWAAPPPNRWRSGGPAGSSSPPNGSPWPSATTAVCSRAVIGRWVGVRPTMCGTGSMAAPPTLAIWPCCAGPIIGRCMRGAGGWPAAPTAGSPPPHPTDDTHPTDDIRPQPEPTQSADPSTLVPGGRMGPTLLRGPRAG
jgi:Domain of unknown function (DUF222)